MSDGGYREAVDALPDRDFGALQYLEDPYVQDAFQDLPDGYAFEREELPTFKKKGDLTGADIAQYLRDHYHDRDVPPAKGLSNMLRALAEIGAVERGGRHRNTRKYKVRAFNQEDAAAVLDAVRWRQAASEETPENPGEQVMSYIEEAFDGPFTTDELRAVVEEESLAERLGGVLGGLVSAGHVKRDGDAYAPA